MKSKHTLILRPKHTLWLVVAVLGSIWYAADPQARPRPVRSVDGYPGPSLLSVHPTAPSGSVVVGTRPGRG